MAGTLALVEGFHVAPRHAHLSPRLPALCRRPTAVGLRMGENGVDADYPYMFDGRLWFRPAIVRVPPQLPPGFSAVSLFGFTIGGVVSLEYDVSPVGPYREYVTMGSLVSKRGALGQWGSRLFVSTQPAEEVCQRVWGVPAEVAAINFVEDGDSLCVEAPPPLEKMQGAGPPSISVSGWGNTRSSAPEAPRRGAVPVLWTPTIKALWAPLIPFASGSGEDAELPLHKLRLSASSLRLQWCGQSASDALGVPLPVGLTVDGVRIEIGPRLSDSGL